MRSTKEQMEKQILLEIGIPTFNRQQALRRTLKALAGQLTGQTRISIVDNCSSYNVEDVVREELGSSSVGDVRITKNIANIGLAGNLLRCFELATSEWMYLLGDDDIVDKALVSTSLKAIETHANSDQINFCAFIARTETTEAVGVNQFIEMMDNYANLNFISTNLYKVDSFRKYLATGYRFSYTLSPHIALTLACMGDGGSFIFSHNKTISRSDVDGEEHWNWAQFCLSQAVLLEHPSLNDETRVSLAHKIETSAKILEKTTANFLHDAVHKSQGRSAKFFYDQLTYRWFYFTSSKTQRFKIRLYRLLFICPKISLSIIFTVLKALGRNQKIIEYSEFTRKDNRI
jgi:glycosyltransferase involved in cell wall biosynthesis